MTPRPLLAALAAGLLLLGACSSDEKEVEATASGEGRSKVGGTTTLCAPPPTIPVAGAAGKLPAGITLPDGAELLEVREVAGSVTVSGQSTQAIRPLQERWRAELKAAGYKIEKDDYEGREAELEFKKGGVEGVIAQTLARCPTGTTRFSISTKP